MQFIKIFIFHKLTLSKVTAPIEKAKSFFLYCNRYWFLWNPGFHIGLGTGFSIWIGTYRFSPLASWPPYPKGRGSYPRRRTWGSALWRNRWRCSPKKICLSQTKGGWLWPLQKHLSSVLLPQVRSPGTAKCFLSKNMNRREENIRARKGRWNEKDKNKWKMRGVMVGDGNLLSVPDMWRSWLAQP